MMCMNTDLCAHIYIHNFQLKNILSEKNNGEFRYVPSRAGQINEETQYVLNHFGVEAPRYISDIRHFLHTLKMSVDVLILDLVFFQNVQQNLFLRNNIP